MKTQVLTAFLVLFLALSVAQQPQLQASLSQAEVSGLNCDATGGAFPLHIRVFIQNTFSGAMDVSYSYTNLLTGETVQAGRACVVGPGDNVFCDLTVPVSLGGEGAGNTTIPVSLSATVNGYQSTLTKDFQVPFRHQPTSADLNTLSQIENYESQFQTKDALYTSSCAKGACCGFQLSNLLVNQSRALAAEARSQLAACNYQGALSAVGAVQNNLRGADDSYDSLKRSCSKALDAYGQLGANITSTNATILARAVCGQDVSVSRAELGAAITISGEVPTSLAQDSYAQAQSLVSQALNHTSEAVAASQDCPPGGLKPPEVATPQPTAVAPPAPSDNLSFIINTLSGLVLVAIVIVVLAALYQTASKGGPKLPGLSLPKAGPKAPPAPSEPKADTSRIDKEFEDWLREAEKKEKEERKRR